MQPKYKPVGGVESVALYPANAVQSALFSSGCCEVSLYGTPIEVELIDDSSTYEERLESGEGSTKVVHELTLVADRMKADKWLSDNFVEKGTYSGFAAVVHLCDGRSLLVGYSQLLTNEQPLYIESITSRSGASPHDKPSVTLLLISQDTEFSREILYSN